MLPAEGINAAFKFAERRQVPPAALKSAYHSPEDSKTSLPGVKANRGGVCDLAGADNISGTVDNQYDRRRSSVTSLIEFLSVSLSNGL